MRTCLIVTATVVASVLLAGLFGNRISRLLGVSPMGGATPGSRCAAMPVCAIVGGIVGIIVAVHFDKR